MKLSELVETIPEFVSLFVYESPYNGGKTVYNGKRCDFDDIPDYEVDTCSPCDLEMDSLYDHVPQMFIIVKKSGADGEGEDVTLGLKERPEKENVMFSLKKRPKMKEEKRLLRKQMALLSEKSHSVGLDARALYDLTTAMCGIMRVMQKG